MTAKESLPVPADSTATTTPEKKRSWIIWALLVIPVFIIEGVGAYILVQRLFQPKSVTSQEVQAATKDKPSKSPPIGAVYLVSDIIVNPAETEGRRFLNVTVALEYEGLQIGEELKKRDFQIRDTLISIFVSKRVDELDDIGDKENLKAEIAHRVNAVLTAGEIKQVYFTNFIMQ